MVLRFLAEDGTPLLVGQTAEENDKLCRRASQRDLWFHLDGQPSPHVVLQLSEIEKKSGGGGGSEVSASTAAAAVRDACQLCKTHSRGSVRRAPRSAVIYVEAKFVGKVKGKGGVVVDPSGTVHLSRTPTRVIVSEDADALERLGTTMTEVMLEGYCEDDGDDGSAPSSQEESAVEPLFAPKPSKEERKAAAAKRRAERAAAKSRQKLTLLSPSASVPATAEKR